MAQYLCIGIFSTQIEAENAIIALQKDGLDITKISILSRDFQTRDFFSWTDTAKEGATELGYWGTVLGAVVGALTGTEFLLVPAIAPVFLTGPIAGLFLGALQGFSLGVAIGGLVGGFTGALLGELETPEYENEIKAGKFALMMRGTPQEQEQAIKVLKDAGYIQSAVII